MKIFLFFLSLTFALTTQASPKKNKFLCTSTDVAKNIATLTFLSDGSGRLLWNEPWHLASSAAEPNSSEEIGDIYELSNFFSDENGGYQLIVSHELSNKRIQGQVEILFQGQSESKYNCK